MVDKIAASICYQIYKKQIYCHTQIRQIQYALQGLISETIKLFFMCILLYLVGYLKYGLFAMIVFSSIRIWAGGYHADTYFKCFLISLSIIYLAVFAGLFIQSNALFILQGIFSFGTIYRFSPAEHKNQPIISKSRRKRIHIISLNILLFWICILFVVSAPWKYIGIHSIFIETISIIYMIVMKKDECIE